MDDGIIEMVHVNRVNSGEPPRAIPNQAANGLGFAEGLETRFVTPKNNRIHEPPAPTQKLSGDDIVRTCGKLQRQDKELVEPYVLPDSPWSSGPMYRSHLFDANDTYYYK